MIRKPAIIAALAAALAASLASAHEFWIQPAAFRPAAGERVAIHLLVGDGFPGEHRAFDSKKALRLEVLAPEAQEKPLSIAGKDGDDPVGWVTVDRPGVWAVVYQGRESVITLEAGEFEAYLREEGLEHVIEARADIGESASPGRESYSRSAKALLCAGGRADGAWGARADLPLEIVPVTNPYSASAGERLEFMLLQRGNPVAGAQVMALCSVEGRTQRTTARTSAEGKASFHLEHPGLWVINAVRMERAAGREDVDWTSTWSSLAFELASAPSR